jgi:hypothetical protein
MTPGDNVVPAIPLTTAFADIDFGTEEEKQARV